MNLVFKWNLFGFIYYEKILVQKRLSGVLKIKNKKSEIGSYVQGSKMIDIGFEET